MQNKSCVIRDKKGVSDSNPYISIRKATIAFFQVVFSHLNSEEDDTDNESYLDEREYERVQDSKKIAVIIDEFGKSNEMKVFRKKSLLALMMR